MRFRNPTLHVRLEFVQDAGSRKDAENSISKSRLEIPPRDPKPGAMPDGVDQSVKTIVNSSPGRFEVVP